MLLQTSNDEDWGTLITIEAADLHALKIPIFVCSVSTPNFIRSREIT